MMVTMRSDVRWESGVSTVHCHTGKHEVLVDEPEAMGGKDAGPNPVQYVLSALGGCFIGIGRIVAKEMKLEIQNVHCVVEGDIDPQGYMGAAGVRPGCQEIRMRIEVTSSESGEKLEAWKDATEARCPIRDTLANPVPVKVMFKQP